MDKLEVGKWYRHDELEGWIFQFKENQYCKYMDCYDRGLLKGQNQFYKKEYEHYSLLETLTPSEALILLANGFELVKHYSLLETLTPREALILLANGFELVRGDLVIKLDDDGLIVCTSKLRINIGWKIYQLSTLTNFTIHALPEAENG